MSAQGIHLKKWILTNHGLLHDRIYCLWNEETGRIVHGQSLPELAEIKVDFSEDLKSLTFKYRGDEITVPIKPIDTADAIVFKKDEYAYDSSDEVNAWFNDKFPGKTLHLLRSNKSYKMNQPFRPKDFDLAPNENDKCGGFKFDGDLHIIN